MKDFIKSQYDALKEELELIADMGVLPVRRLALTLTSLGEALDKIRAYLVEHPFSDQAAEIGFFKHEKTLFTCEQLYAIELFTLESYRPVGDVVALRAYYEVELAVIRRFFNQYRFLFEYYRHGLQELDHLLFVRGQRPSHILLPEGDGADPDFSTAAYKLFAKFMALERLQEYIINELVSLDNPAGPPDGGGRLPNLTWTGESINLIELAYGIWLTGQINNGTATLKEIITWLQITLRIDLGHVPRRWLDIGKRKKISLTKFLDHMRTLIIQKLNDANS